MDITIYQIRKEDVITYEYKHRVDHMGVQVHLLFYDGHYDILEINRDPLLEFNDDKEEEYYSDLNSNTIEGECI